MRRFFRSFLRTRIIAGGILLGCIVISISILYFRPEKASSAGWWNDGYRFRQTVTLTNSTTVDAVKVPYRINVDTATLISASKLQADGRDIRIVSQNGEPVRFQIEQSTLNTATTGIWFEGSVKAGEKADYYIYYGNEAVGSPRFASDVSSVTANGATVEMNDGFGYSTSTSHGRISDIRKNGTNIGVNGTYRHTASYPGNWWDDRAFTPTLLAEGPLFVEVQMNDTSYGHYSSFGTSIMMFANGFVSNRVYMNYNNTGSEQLYYYLHFDSGTRNSVYVNSSEAVVDVDANVSLGLSSLGDNWFGQRWTATGMYGGTIINPDGSDWTSGATSTRASYFQTNYSSTQAYTPGSSREIRFGTFAGDGGLNEMTAKGSAYGGVLATTGSEEVSPGPAAYWKFDEGYGTTSNDSSGGNHTASLVGGTAWQTEDQCVNGKCLSFDGVNDTVSMGIGTDYFPLNTFSMCSWVRTPGLGTGMTKAGIISMTYGLIFELDGSGNFQTGIDNGSSIVTQTVSQNLFDNQYHHLCLTYDGTQRHMYIDGVKKLSANTTWSGTTRWPTNGVNLGTNNNNTMYKLKGSLDEVKIYPYTRSDLQIKSDYIAGATDKGSSVVLGAIDNAPLADGLVGYWKMDEASWNGTAGEVVDSSGAGNHGTRGGNATTAGGKYGQGGTFDGSGDYVSIAGSSTLDLQDLTVVSWNYAANYDANMFMFEKTTNGVVNTQYSLFYDTGGSSSRIYFRTMGLSPQDLSVTDNAAGPITNQWNMIVGTYDASERTKKIYVNGKLVASQTGITGTINTNPAGTSWIGTYGGGVGYAFNGRIDETRVYRRALSEAEVQDLYQWAPGPVGFYTFDEGNGTSANDRSGNGNTGTLTNGPIWDAGKYGSAVQFDGNDDHVLLSSQLNMTDAFTFSAWFNKSNSSGIRTLVSSNVSGGPKIFFDTNDTLGIRVVSTIAYINVGYTASMNGTWHYVSVTRDSSGAVKASLDGGPFVSAFTQTGTSTWQVIGSTPPDGGQRWAGNIDEVRFYNYARTQDQILQDMASSAVPGANSDPVPLPVVEFSLDEGSGATANNSGTGGSALNGVLRNSPTWSSTARVGKSLSLDGLNDYLEVPNNTTLKYTGGDYTISAWVNRNSAETDQGRIFSKPWNGSGQYNYVLYVHTDGTLVFSLLGASAWQTVTTQTLPIDTWTHLLVSIEGSTKVVNIYMNGELIKSDTYNITSWTPTIADANLPLAIGTLYPYGGSWGGVASHAFKGYIDEVKIFNAALSADQVLQEYNLGTPAVMGAISTGSDGTSPDSSSSREYCVPGDTTSCGAPILELKLDENSGTTIYDTSDSSLTSTAFLGNPTWAAGKKGSALSFNGSTDGVNFSGPTTYSTMTMTAWAYIDAASPTGDIVGYAHTNSNAYGFTFYIEGNTLRAKAETNADQYFYSNVTYDVSSLKNKWIHLAMTWQNLGTGSGGCDAEVKLYVDGILVDSATDNVTNTPYTCTKPYPYPFTLGGTTVNSLTRATKVKIDDIRVYNYVRTPAQIAWEYNKGAPVAHYKFDECEGTTIFNSAETGNREAVGNHGTLTVGGGGSNTSVGTCATSGAWADGASGKEGASMDFDGTDDYVGVSGNWLYSEQTVSFWAKDTWSSSSGMPISSLRWVSPDHDGFRFIGGTNQMTYSIYNNSQSEYTYNQPLSGSDWNHFVLTWTPTVTKAYLNGVLVNTTNRTNTFDANTTDMDIGRYNYLDNSYFSGQIDEVRIYNYALTDAQVRDVYNNGAVSFK